MARINQTGVGRKATGTLDGVIYYVRNGVTYARATPVMPARIYKTFAARKRQAIFKMVQMHLNRHLPTIRVTFTPQGNGTSRNRYYSVNGKALTKALDALAERYVAGEVVTISDVEAAICAYAAQNPEAIVIALKNGYKKVYLTGEWPSTITLYPDTSRDTVIHVMGH